MCYYYYQYYYYFITIISRIRSLGQNELRVPFADFYQWGQHATEWGLE